MVVNMFFRRRYHEQSANTGQDGGEADRGEGQDCDGDIKGLQMQGNYVLWEVQTLIAFLSISIKFW